MVHQTFVWWALYVLFRFVKSLIRHLGLAIGNARRVRRFSWTLKSALVQVMAWHQTGDEPLHEPTHTQVTDRYRCWHLDIQGRIWEITEPANVLAPNSVRQSTVILVMTMTKLNLFTSKFWWHIILIIYPMCMYWIYTCAISVNHSQGCKNWFAGAWYFIDP